MPLRDNKPESHVLAAAAPQESTLEILKATARTRPNPPTDQPRPKGGSFIEDVEQWVRKYLNLADEVLENPAQPDKADTGTSAA